MSDETFGLDLIEIFSSLTDIPLTYSDRTEALARVTRLGQQALGSHACVLTFLDIEKKELSYVA